MGYVDLEKVAALRMKDLLADSDCRQEVIARFPLITIGIAKQMQKAIETKKFVNPKHHEELNDLIDHCEKEICSVFKKTFGHDLIPKDFITGNKLMDGPPSELEQKLDKW